MDVTISPNIKFKQIDEVGWIVLTKRNGIFFPVLVRLSNGMKSTLVFDTQDGCWEFLREWN
jgi:hypothetical protein